MPFERSSGSSVLRTFDDSNHSQASASHRTHSRGRSIPDPRHHSGWRLMVEGPGSTGASDDHLGSGEQCSTLPQSLLDRDR